MLSPMRNLADSKLATIVITADCLDKPHTAPQKYPKMAKNCIENS
jgi:hypothetical protein